MSSRLGRVRRSIGSRQEVPQLALLQAEAENAAQALILRTQSDQDIPVDVPESPGRQRRATTVGNLTDLKQSSPHASPESSSQRRFSPILGSIPCSVIEGNEEEGSPMPTSRPSPRPIRHRVPSIDCKLPPLVTSSAINSPSTSPAYSPSNKRHSFPVQGNGKDVADSMGYSVKSQLEYLQLQGHDTTRPIASSSFTPKEATLGPTSSVNVVRTQEEQERVRRDVSFTKTQDAVQSKLPPDETADEDTSPTKAPLQLQLSLTNIGSDGSALLHRIVRRKSSFTSSTDHSVFTNFSGRSSPPKRIVRSPSASEQGNPTSAHDASNFHPMERSSSIARVLHEVMPLHDIGDYDTDTIPVIAGPADRPASDEPSQLSINISNSPLVQHNAPSIAEVDEAAGSFKNASSRTATVLASNGIQRAVDAGAPAQAVQPNQGLSRTDVGPSRQPSKSRLLKKLSMLDAQESIRLMLLRRKSSMMRIMQTQHAEEQEQDRRASAAALATHKPVVPPLVTSKSTSIVLAKKKPSPRKSCASTARNTTVCNLM